MNEMRVLLRNVATGLFYAEDGQWTADRTKANDFHNSRPAAQLLVHNGWQDVELFMDFGDPRYDAHMGAPAARRSVPPTP